MRITCVIHSLSGGGAERLMAGLVSRLCERHQVTLVTLDDGAHDRYSLDRRVTRVPLALLEVSRNLWMALRNNRRRVGRLREAIRESRPAVVLSFCDKNNVLTLVACGPLDVPVVVSEHTDPRHQAIGPIWSQLRRRYYRRASASIALTQETAAVVARWTGHAPAVIPPAVERNPLQHRSGDSQPAPAPGTVPKPASDSQTDPTTPLSPAAQQSAGERDWVRGPGENSRSDPTIPLSLAGQRSAGVRDSHGRTADSLRWVTIGRLAPEKAFDRAIDAFAALAPQFPNWSLDIAGEGPERERLEQRIAERGMVDRVRLLGWVGDVARLLSESDAFVLTSRYEGFPVSLLEAMAAGLACVAVDCESGPSEVIRHQENGLLVPQNDPPGLRAAMRQVMDRPELRRQLGQAASEVADHYSWAAFVREHERVLEQAACTGRAGSGRG